MNNGTEGLSTYKAIALLGRQSIDKLVENGLVVVNAREYNNLRADLHALSSQLEVMGKKNAEGLFSESKPL